MTLRTRLFLALLLLALIPSVTFTVFTLGQLDRATRRWFSPRVAGTLEGAQEVSRSQLTRLEAVVLAAADRWAARIAAGAPIAVADARREVASSGLDFVQLYRLEGGHWRLTGALAAEKVLLVDSLDLGDEVGPALAGARLVHSRRGALGGVSRIGRDRVLLAGLRVAPDVFDRLRQLDEDVAYYRRLSVLVDVQRRWVWVLVAGLVVLVLLVAAVVADRIARETSRPLGDLAAALDRVAAGDLGSRVEPHGPREVSRLGRAFNLMTARLGQAREAVRRAEREAAWRDVARRLAHEIKNPLTPMRLSLHRLQKRVDLVPAAERNAVQESIAALLDEIEQLSRLAEQFSQYARLPEPRFETFDLAEVARSAAGLHGGGQVPVRVEAEGECPVRGDRLMVARALQNLILNAYEASPPGAAIEVRVCASDGTAQVEVLDRGPGVDESVKDRVFEPYVSTKARGSGLGLSLVRDIALQHGGEVSLRNRDGGGAAARLTLPLASAA